MGDDGDMPTTEELAATCRTKRERMEIARARHRWGELTYDELAVVAQDFCTAFDAYHRSKFGKPKRLDYRAVIR